MLMPRHVSSYMPELDNITTDLISHIRRVRSKIGAYDRCIKTVRGVGYRFKEP